MAKVEKGEPTVADFIADFIAEKKAPGVFHLSGGMIAFITDAIFRKGVTPLVTNRHEQASGFAAEGATRASGISAFALATSGPGATNLVTPIASCYFDSTPTIFITGQVNTNEIKKSKSQRQNGFQELDVLQMVAGITKATYSPRTPGEVVRDLHTGWELANSGRMGPVLLDIPIDLQQELLEHQPTAISGNSYDGNDPVTGEVFDKINKILRSALSPLILLGGGVRQDNAVEIVTAFAKKYNIPAVSTLMGLDSATNLGDLYLGFIGSYGNSWANKALQEADCLIVLGCRLDPRQTGNSISKFIHDKKIIRVDIDRTELTGRVLADISVNSRISDFLTDERLRLEPIQSKNRLIEVSNRRESFPQISEQEVFLELNPNELVQEISILHERAAGFIVDVGQHQMWAAQSLKLISGQRFITSGGLGAMGFSLPAAIGASIATRDSWAVILGDGCAQLSAPELQTIADLNLPLTIYVMNNNQHGMVAQFQDEYMDSRYAGTRAGYSTPRFSELATSYGFKNTFSIRSLREFREISNSLLNLLNEPTLVEVHLSPSAKALPKMKHSE